MATKSKTSRARRRFNPDDVVFPPQNLDITTDFAAFCDPTLTHAPDQIPEGEDELVYFVLYDSSGTLAGGYMCRLHMAYDVFRYLKERGAKQFSIKVFPPGEHRLITVSNRDWYPLQ
jgi:hypothetical protein